MNFYIREPQYTGIDAVTARSKARCDAETVMDRMGFTSMSLGAGRKDDTHGLSRLLWHLKTHKLWKEKTKDLKDGDALLIQSPCTDFEFFFPDIVKNLAGRGVKVILLLHDLERYRHMKDKNNSLGRRLRFRAEEKTLRLATSIIVHNDRMKADLQASGIDANRMIPLKIFDYLADEPDISGRKNGPGMPLIVAGNLSKNKSGYLYALPKTVKFNLYGMGFDAEAGDNIDLKGAFSPEELPSKLDGSYGLVWDGPSSESCIGATGEYLKINNPHKTSLYLAAGIPVAIWKEAALASFITENGCGITLGKIEDATDIGNRISQDQYEQMRRNTEGIGRDLREGRYLQNAINIALDH